MKNSLAELLQTRKLYLLAGIASLLLSAAISSQQHVINPDAICYLLSAQEVGQSGVGGAMHLCGQASWPFYSLLIYFFSQLGYFTPTTIAYGLDAVFTLISVLSFIAIVELLGGARMIALAAFVILTAHQFNSVREYIVRDHGFWAFYLLSIVFMIRFMRIDRLGNALGFGLSLALAALFRIEGAVFLMLVPLIAFFNQGDWRSRLFAFGKLNIVSFVVMLVLAVGMVLHPQESMQRLGRLPELVTQFTHGLSLALQHYHKAQTDLVTYILPSEAARDASMVWGAVLVVLYSLNVLNNLSWMAAALVIYGWKAHVSRLFARSDKLVLRAYLLVNVGITLMFFSQRLFFSKRYLIALSLILLLSVPFALDKLLHAAVGTRRRRAAYVAMIAISVSAVLGVMTTVGTSRNYLVSAGSWIAENVPSESKMYINDVQLAYYSEHYGKNIFAAIESNKKLDAVLQTRLRGYEYAAFRLPRNKNNAVAALMTELHAQVVQEFKNQSGDQVVIYRMESAS
jgi:hypothetical protein